LRSLFFGEFPDEEGFGKKVFFDLFGDEYKSLG
jgi:hypothetical protein